MRKAGLAAGAVALAVAAMLSGCASGAISHTAASPRAATHTMANGMVMSGSAMPANGGAGANAGSATPTLTPRADVTGPSASARMICAGETARSVRRNLALTSTPTGLPTWRNGEYTCRYRVGAGALVLSVKDLDSQAAGRAWFNRTRLRLAGATTITGMANLGFPAVQTPTGQVAFLKDGKTLLVDAAGVPHASLPPGFSRTAVAYGVASAVIACWSE